MVSVFFDCDFENIPENKMRATFMTACKVTSQSQSHKATLFLFSENFSQQNLRKENIMVQVTVKERQQLIEKASNAKNPLESLQEMFVYTKDDFRVRLKSWRKADIPQKTLKWAIKLAERNVGPFYSTCSLGWQPKIKQADMNKHWARYLVAYTEDTNIPVAYCMFRFDVDYERSVLYW